MSSNNRNLWIIVIILVTALCCCMIVSVAGAVVLGLVPWQWVRSTNSPDPIIIEQAYSGGMLTEVEETVFAGGELAFIELNTYAGSIRVQGAEGDDVHIAATKSSRNMQSLDRIVVDINERGGGLVIVAKKPVGFNSSSVSFELTVPRSTRLDLNTGSGSIEIRGINAPVHADTASGSVKVSAIEGPLDVHSASGSLEFANIAGPVKASTNSGGINLKGIVGDTEARTLSGGIEYQGGSGNVILDTLSGGINYEGDPSGDCRFNTKSGGIWLTLPQDLNMRVDLKAIFGQVNVGYDAISGDVNQRSVEGVIGRDGSDGLIRASTPSGDVTIVPR